MEYLKYFPKKLRYEALEKAHETRKFEIELYWKRSAYFWAFVAATFGAYFTFFKNDNSELIIYKFVVLFIGVSFSHAWFAITRGSKYWQENWELHVDNLENDITGPLYKIIKNTKSNKLLGPKALSVSKINMLLSINIILTWNVIIILNILNLLKKYSINNVICIICILTIIILFLNIFLYYEFQVMTKSHLKTTQINEHFSLRN